MANWKYNPANYNENGFGLIPEGNYRVRIESAVEKTSRTGKDMVELTLAVSGYNSKIWYYLVFDSSNERMIQMTDQRLGSIYDSFGIARIRQRADDSGTMRSEVSYFLSRKKVDALPAWIESGQKAVQATVQDDVVNPEMASFDDTGSFNESGETYGAGIF